MAGLTTAAGNLCISIVEARNILAEDITEPRFYVRLRLGPNEMKTDVVRDTLAPKFLKDARLGVPNPETDMLRVELLQVGPRGDLVIGCEELRVITITSKGTLVQWMQLKTSDGDVSGELCLVLRYLSAGANRPMSPSYAIAARTAKERALDLAPANLGMLQPKGLFQDLASKATGASAAAPATPASTPSKPSPPPQQQQQQQQAPPTPPLKAESRTGGAATTGSSPAAALPPPALPRAESASSGARLTGGRSASGSKGKAPAAAAGGVPVPLAILGGALAGAAVYFLMKRHASDAVREGGTVSAIGASPYAAGRRGRHDHGRVPLDTLTRVFPGDRLRIR